MTCSAPLNHENSPWTLPPEWLRSWKVIVRENRNAPKTPRRG